MKSNDENFNINEIYNVVDEYYKLPFYKRWLYTIEEYWFDLVPSPVYRFYVNFIKPRTWINTFKWLFQRLYRGFDDRQTWSLDWSLYVWLLPRLKRFKELNNGYNDLKYESFEEYQNELQKRIEQLEFIIDCEREDEFYFQERTNFNEWLMSNLNELWW